MEHHGDVVRLPKKRWSDRSLQVVDLKAAGTLSHSHMTEATWRSAISFMLARFCMHHMPSGTCLAKHSSARAEVRSFDLGSSRAHDETLPDADLHRTRCCATAQLSGSSAQATGKPARGQHRVRPRAPRWHSERPSATIVAASGWIRSPAAHARRSQQQRWSRG